MRPNIARIVVGAALSLACLSPLAVAQAAPTYSFTDLGLLRSGDDFSSGHDLNEHGQIVGVSGSLTIERAVLWESRAPIDLGPLPGEVTSMASGINATGQIVGGARRESDDENSRAFHSVIWNDRAITPLDEPDGATESMAHAINDGGQVVGFAGTTERSHAALWQGTTLTILSTDPSVARDINDRGQIAGTVEQSAVLWENDGSTLVILGDLPGGQSDSSATAINDAGQVVGQSDAAAGPRAFLWTNGLMLDLGVLPGSSESSALDINSRGQVVGVSRSGDGAPSSAFVWTDGEMFDLNELTADLGGWRLLQAYAINDRGWIVGQALAPDRSEFHAFLLTPVPEPAAMLLLGLGVAGLIARRHRATRLRI